MNQMQDRYKHTIYASYIGYITQAVINNFAPLLFLTFQTTYEIPLSKITLLVTINFGIQLLVDFIAAKYVDRIGYKPCIVAAHILAAAGLAGLGILPDLFSDPYIGILASILLYAMGGGLIEVLVSPIVEACPSEQKAGAMSLLHSFYCWGHVFVVVSTTLFFFVIGISHWRILSCLWAVIPLVNAIYYSRVPIAVLHEDGKGMSIRELFSSKLFWVLAILMVCAGASEQAMSQWASVFAELGLSISKTAGDLAGPCMFAVMMGITRLFYGKYSEKIRLKRFMAGSGILCIAGYLLASLSVNPVLSLSGCALVGLSVGIMWPGTFSLAAEKCAGGGTAMFAFLALAGDLGCSMGPTAVGMISNAFDNQIKTGLLAAIIFPALLLAFLFFLLKLTKKQ